MKIPFRFLLAAAAIATGLTPAHADTPACGDVVKATLSRAYPTAQPSTDGRQLLLDGNITIDLAANGFSTPHGVACKIWPAQPDLMLVAVPLIDTKQSGDGQNFGDIELLVVDAKTGEIRQRLRQPGLMADDAVAISQIDLDTAAYRLKSDVLAFGLRIDMRNGSQIVQYSETTLRLYAIIGGELRAVLDGIVVSMERGENEGGCTVEDESNVVTLSMDGTVRNGFRGIIATQRHGVDRSHPDKDGECITKPGRKSSRVFSMSYDGKQYAAPKALKPDE